MPIISIDGLVHFAPNWGVIVTKQAVSCDPYVLQRAIQLAYKHINDELLRDACCGGCGPLVQWEELDFSEYLILVEEIKRQNQVKEKTRRAKRLHAKKRRSEFSSIRSHLVLSLINQGTPYVCAIEGCPDDDLTLDHIIPLSRGGTDDVTNLRFLCRQHNSQKGDRE